MLTWTRGVTFQRNVGDVRAGGNLEHEKLNQAPRQGTEAKVEKNYPMKLFRRHETILSNRVPWRECPISSLMEESVTTRSLVSAKDRHPGHGLNRCHRIIRFISVLVNEPSPARFDRQLHGQSEGWRRVLDNFSKTQLSSRRFLLEDLYAAHLLESSKTRNISKYEELNHF